MHQTRVAIGSERLFAKSKWQTREAQHKIRLNRIDAPEERQAGEDGSFAVLGQIAALPRRAQF